MVSLTRQHLPDRNSNHISEGWRSIPSPERGVDGDEVDVAPPLDHFDAADQANSLARKGIRERWR